MNIQNRLKKLQNQIIGNDSEFCVCDKEPQFIVLIPSADGKGKMIDGKPYEEPPEFCRTCGKPNPEPLHTTFTISTKAELTGEA
jgi:hypothetical protein